jgi:hypothetical protein
VLVHELNVGGARHRARRNGLVEAHVRRRHRRWASSRKLVTTSAGLYLLRRHVNFPVAFDIGEAKSSSHVEHEAMSPQQMVSSLEMAVTSASSAVAVPVSPPHPITIASPNRDGQPTQKISVFMTIAPDCLPSRWQFVALSCPPYRASDCLTSPSLGTSLLCGAAHGTTSTLRSRVDERADD